MKGDLGSPLVRAVVRLERVKRAAPSRGPRWRRSVALRTWLVRQMSAAEQEAALELVVGESCVAWRAALAELRLRRAS